MMKSEYNAYKRVVDGKEMTFGSEEEYKKHMAERNVNHPSHYTSGKIEVIDFIEDKKLGFHLGNVVKYICRAGKKMSADKTKLEKQIEDLEKAAWYLNRYIGLLKRGEENVKKT